MSDQSVNSQATSKAGLSMGSDQDMTAIAGGSGLQKIIPEEGSSSCDSSPRHLMQAASSLVSEQSSKLPCNTRSVNNRFFKAQLKENEGKILNLKWFALAIEDGTKGGGKITFSDSEKLFAENVEDYFILKEDKCLLSHNCAGRVMNVRSDMIDRVMQDRPKDDPRDITYLLSLTEDGCIIDTGWKIVALDED